jgi:hypothetical protein
LKEVGGLVNLKLKRFHAHASIGLKVTALVRNPSSLSPQPNLDTFQGTPEKKEDIDTAFECTGSDVPQAVIVTLNAPRESDSPFAKPLVDPRFLADCVANVREAMKAHAVKKIVIMSAFGVGDSFSNLNFLMRPVIKHSNMAIQYEDHRLVDEETRPSGLNWVFVRPAMLTDKEAKPVKDLGDTGEHASFMPSISRASVAKFMVDAVESDKWEGRTPVICD